MKHVIRGLFCWLLLQPVHADPVGTGFTYQGQLTINGATTTGVYDFSFELHDAAQSGQSLGLVIVEDLAVNNSIFTTELDFGDAPFMGEQLWLEIGVRDGGSVGGFQQMLPRQKLNASPYAIQSQFIADDAVGSLQIVDGSIGTSDIANQSITTPLLADSAVAANQLANAAVGTSKLENAAVTTVKIADAAITQSKLADDAVGADQVMPSEVQLRVANTCSVGSFIQSINPDGSVVCGSAEPPAEPMAGSVLLSPTQQQQLNRWAGNENQLWQRCYQLTVDGASSATFHSQCDNRGPSISIMQKSDGHLFGGYTQNSWSGSFGYRGHDPAFLFVLNPTTERFPSGYYYDRSTYSHINYGTTFGNGHDIYINTSMQLAYCNFPYTYSCDGVSGASPNNACSQRLCGLNAGVTVNETLTELEVWIMQE
ncbi:TLD domain-containing protein [Marinicella meishanensis]|uniref:TLD domain-containing protein n=1 Tax=Marinicella meishanensis TaxID=2873263 RepID=UPI001CBE69DE|nr:TLD domain-containing protein [Marinicella sp. NBU2979]